MSEWVNELPFAWLLIAVLALSYIAATAVYTRVMMLIVDRRGRILACGALKEYSPSVAEVAAIAVAREAQGNGLGKEIVAAVEELATKRGILHVFALTLQPAFFEAIGYQRVDRARYPEKIRRDCLGCARRFACDEICFAKELRVDAKLAAA